MLHKLTVIALAVLSVHAVTARAEATDQPMFSFSGFGTLGVTHSSEKNADFIPTFYQQNGVGGTRNWDFNTDSKIAAQVTANFTSQWSAVLQVISEQRYDNSYVPLVEWANLKYAFTPDFSVRVGRVVLPTYLVSDSRKVGYANPWIRPPVELYNLVPITNSDGVDLSYRFRVGAVTNTIQAGYGRNTILTKEGPDGNATRVLNIVDNVDYGALSVHLSYLQLILNIPALEPLFGAYNAPIFGPNDIYEKYAPDLTRVVYRGIGASYDPGKWFVQGEFGRQNTNSAFGEKRAWYVTGGYRIGQFTPYLGYANLKQLSSKSDPGINIAALPPFPGLAQGAMGLNAVLNSFLQSTDQQSVTLGTRWDFAKNADLKVQFERLDLGNGSVGTLRNFKPGYQPGGKVNVFSLAVDFVF